MHDCPITNKQETGCKFISSQTLSFRVEVAILGATGHIASHIYVLLCIRIITYVNIASF